MAAVAVQADQTGSRHRLSTPLSAQAPEGNLSAPIFSPINEMGSFEFDRVLKSGSLLKRRRRTNSWDTVRLVLRPNLLSVYRDAHETRLKHQVNLSEVTAVALRRDPRRKGSEGVFVIFSPSRNFHLEAEGEVEAKAWIDILRKEARIDPDSETIISSTSMGMVQGFARLSHSAGRSSMASARLSGGSSDALDTGRPSTSLPIPLDLDTGLGVRLPRVNEPPNLSSSEAGSFSDFSEGPSSGGTRNTSFRSRVLSQASRYGPSRAANASQSTEQTASSAVGERVGKNFYMMNAPADEARVLWHGYLQCLKNKRGVRQWKTYWAVLRAKNLALYKNEEEYAALLILPLTTILDAVETDPVAKGKDCCMQIITEERSYRFCCSDEDDLSRWLGAFKSTLASQSKKSG